MKGRDGRVGGKGGMRWDWVGDRKEGGRTGGGRGEG